MKKLLILNNNYFGDKLGGISIRFLEMARALSKNLDVTLALSNTQEYQNEEIKTARFASDSDILKLFKSHDAVLTRGFNVINSPKLNNHDIPMIFDLLCPFFFESLEGGKDSEATFTSSTKEDINLIKKMACRGDFFVCANENQRNFWLAHLHLNQRITQKIYNDDPSLKNLIDIVPFGLPSQPPKHTKKVIKGVMGGIKDTDKIVTWFGGIWDWLDPLSPINAIKSICRKRDDIKLLYVGIKHPDPRSKPHTILKKVMDEAKSSGLLNKNIFFIDWVPYEERANYLLESDIGIVTHGDNLETKFSWRTRVLDYLWSGLPVILTKGDPMSGLIEKHKLGITVNYNDPQDIEKAIISIIDDPGLASGIKNNIEKTKPQYAWNKVVEPIAKFCREPIRTSKTRGFFG